MVASSHNKLGSLSFDTQILALFLLLGADPSTHQEFSRGQALRNGELGSTVGTTPPLPQQSLKVGEQFKGILSHVVQVADVMRSSGGGAFSFGAGQDVGVCTNTSPAPVRPSHPCLSVGGAPAPQTLVGRGVSPLTTRIWREGVGGGGSPNPKILKSEGHPAESGPSASNVT